MERDGGAGSSFRRPKRRNSSLIVTPLYSISVGCSVADGQASRLPVLRLTLLSQQIVKAIMKGRQPEGVTLPALVKGFPTEWDRQRAWSAT